MTAPYQQPAYPRVQPDQSNPPKPYELMFQKFLSAHGYSFRVEPDKLLHQPYRPGHSIRGMTPDIRLEQPVLGYTIYLELTEADRFVTARQLPAKVRQRNRQHARSHRSYISPAQYLALKTAKIQLTMQLHPNVVIVLIDYATQQAIYAQPNLLTELISRPIKQLWLAA